MPKYFFDVLQSSDLPPAPDEIGEELPNDEAAWRMATISAGDILKDFDGKMRPGQEWALDVADENRRPLFHILISTKLLTGGAA